MIKLKKKRKRRATKNVFSSQKLTATIIKTIPIRVISRISIILNNNGSSINTKPLTKRKPNAY
jgi:hypothetical protein